MTPVLGLLNIGTTELIIVVVVAIMLFGGDLPDVARKAARYVGKLRSMADDLSRELRHGEHAKGMDMSREVRDVEAAVREAGKPPARADGKPPILPNPEAGRDPFADDPVARAAARDAGTFETEPDEEAAAQPQSNPAVKPEDKPTSPAMPDADANDTPA